MTPVKVTTGQGPIVLGQPHGGTFVPPEISARLNDVGQELSDTDWHINRLYSGLIDDATVVEATFHRYVIDANRDPAGVSLYPGQNTTTLCPTTDFDGQDIWKPGQSPTEPDILSRKEQFHTPYHSALSNELERVKALHGFAILLDCHSIRSNIPFLFEGTLPVFNIGTNNGTTCDPQLEAATVELCQSQSNFDTVVNGRFKGGWTTRHYGQPSAGIHVVQMELAQRTYMDEQAPWTYRADFADQVRPILRHILHAFQDIAHSGALTSQETS
jgi:formiminoglutamase